MATSGDQETYRLAPAVDCGTHRRVAWPPQVTRQRLRTNTGIEPVRHPHRYDQPHKHTTHKKAILIFEYVLGTEIIVEEAKRNVNDL
jgi:hypothetical protein